MTHPLGHAGENATRTLLEILTAITQVSLITANLPDDSEIRNEYPVTEISRVTAAQTNIPLAALRFVRNQLRLCAVITRRDEPVVLFFGATAYLLPVAWARLLGRTVVIEPRGDVPLTLRLEWERRLPSPLASMLAGVVRLLERTGFALSHRVVTYTPAMAEQLGLDPSSNRVYTHGARYVDVDHFRPQIPYTDRDQTIGYIGRIDEEKGVRALADVVQQLPSDMRFRFVGDGNLTGWLRSHLGEEIDAGHVEFTGWIDHDNIPTELNRLRLLVLPSSPTEGLPTIVLEALACGTPVFVTPVSGVPDIIHPEKTGFHIQSTEPEQMATHIVSILRRDDLPTIATNGRELIEEDYSFQAAVERYRELFDSLKS